MVIGSEAPSGGPERWRRELMAAQREFSLAVEQLAAATERQREISERVVALLDRIPAELHPASQPPLPSPESGLLSDAEAAKMIGVSASWMRKMRMRGGCGPRFIRMGRMIRYSREDLDQWIKMHRETLGVPARSSGR